jgi:hypothetical protein
MQTNHYQKLIADSQAGRMVATLLGTSNYGLQLFLYIRYLCDGLIFF